MTTLRVRGVLLDMDGTLVDSTAVVEDLWRAFAHAVGADFAEVIAFAHGRPTRDTVARYATDAELAEHWLATIHDAEATHFDEVPEIPGAGAFLRALPDGRWAVVTSALTDAARQRIATVGLPVPSTVIGADAVDAGKPDPEGYLAAARAIGADPTHCVVFEDTEAGIAAARAAGAAAVVVGGLDSPVSSDLPRIPDFTRVSVSDAGMWIEIDLGD